VTVLDRLTGGEEPNRRRGVRVRFAPAPTGYLHVGNARTALYDWLFARHHGGVFVLRIEDTDRDRSTDESVEGIQEVLRWLGVDWDEGPTVGGPFEPYRQSERLGLYRQAVDDLAATRSAYRCYCTPEELAQRRKDALARGKPPGYDGRCRSLTDEQRQAFEAEGRPFAWRFHTGDQDVVVADLIRGEARFPASDIKDFVMLRSDGTPTYLLAAAVDDWKMKITHVLRGEDLFSSTPRQMLLLQALGVEELPEYAHLPLLLGPDRQPLSKRHGSVSVEWFRDHGYLPEAMVNYLALLGWSYDDHTTFFSVEDLVKHFDLNRVSRNPAAFDPEKLEWMNGHYIREADPEAFAAELGETLARREMKADAEAVRQAASLVQERSRTLEEAAELLRFLFQDVEPDEKAAKALQGQGEYLAAVADRLAGLKEWKAGEIEEALRAIREERELSSRKAFQPIRAAVTGRTVTPPLFESIALLGKDRTLSRLRAAAS
jgi:glutamyl-tRNA synthetase